MDHNTIASALEGEGPGPLSRILSKLDRFRLSGHILNKGTAIEAHGGYCDVFVGHVPSEHVRHRHVTCDSNGQVKVAIKTFRVILKQNIAFAKILAREISVWAKLDHPNILPLLGFVFERDYPTLISEWMDNGTVRDFLVNNPSCGILHLAVGIAEGLKYLHDRDIIHSDMKPDNVLVSKDGEPLICDFGVSRMLDSSHSNFVSTTHGNNPRGTIRYMAMELLKDEAKHSKESDVWAYGMTLYEIVTKQIPFSHLRNDVQVMVAIVSGELPSLLDDPVYSSTSSSISISLMCDSCWDADPDIRLTMAEIVSSLYEEIQRTLTDVEVDSLHQTLAAFEPILQVNPNSLLRLIRVAEITRKMGNHTKPIEYFQRMLQFECRIEEARSALGHCYLLQDDLQKAQSAYEQASYLLPNPKEDPKLWYSNKVSDFDKANEGLFLLGIIYKQQGKYTDSLDCFDIILRKPPSPLAQADVWFQIGHVHEKRKDYVRAKNAHERVVQENATHANVLQQLGWLYHQEGSTFQGQDLAITYLTKSLEADPSDAQDWYLLGRVYMAGHKYNKAHEAYQQAVYRNGQNPTFWCSIGVLYFQIDQYHDAFNACSRSIHINLYIPEVWHNLGLLFESCKRQSDAIYAYARAAELGPNNDTTNQRLALLRQAQQTGQAVQIPVPLPQDVHPTTCASEAGPLGTMWYLRARSKLHANPVTPESGRRGEDGSDNAPTPGASSLQHNYLRLAPILQNSGLKLSLSPEPRLSTSASESSGTSGRSSSIVNAFQLAAVPQRELDEHEEVDAESLRSLASGKFAVTPPPVFPPARVGGRTPHVSPPNNASGMSPMGTVNPHNSVSGAAKRPLSPTSTNSDGAFKRTRVKLLDRPTTDRSRMPPPQSFSHPSLMPFRTQSFRSPEDRVSLSPPPNAVISSSNAPPRVSTGNAASPPAIATLSMTLNSLSRPYPPSDQGRRRSKRMLRKPLKNARMQNSKKKNGEKGRRRKLE